MGISHRGGWGDFHTGVELIQTNFCGWKLWKKLKKLPIITNISSYILAKNQRDWIRTE
jgi:hypothetical protein